MDDTTLNERLVAIANRVRYNWKRAAINSAVTELLCEDEEDIARRLETEFDAMRIPTNPKTVKNLILTAGLEVALRTDKARRDAAAAALDNDGADPAMVR